MPGKKKQPLSLLELMKPQPYELPRYNPDYEEKGPTHGVVIPGGGRESGPYLGVEGGMDRARGIYPEMSAGYNVQRGPNQYGAGATYQRDPNDPYAAYGGPLGLNFNFRREF